MKVSKDPAYNAWKKMRSRCNNQNDEHFKWYGGKGVTVCKRWDNFALFIKDMGPRPSPKHSIDRINNDKGYQPDNCRWATQQEQNRNRAANRYVTHDGETLCLAEWAERVGIDRTAVYNRLRRGWKMTDAITRQSVRRRSVLTAGEARFTEEFGSSPGHHDQQ